MFFSIPQLIMLKRIFQSLFMKMVCNLHHYLIEGRIIPTKMAKVLALTKTNSLTIQIQDKETQGHVAHIDELKKKPKKTKTKHIFAFKSSLQQPNFKKKKKNLTLGFKKSDEQSIWTKHMKVKNQNLKLTQATDEPKIKAPSSSSYLYDQSPDGSRSRVSSEVHCIVQDLRLVSKLGWMGVSFGSEECFDLYGLLFLTYYVLE